jgi:hypothetical protein
MNELADKPKLKRPMDPAAMGNDVAMMRALVADLNNPNLTGAVVPPGESLATVVPSEVPAGMTAEAAQRLQAQMVLQQQQSIAAIPGPLTPHEQRALKPMPQIKLSTAPVPASPPPSSHQPAQKLFFTGHPLVGKKWLAEKIHARVLGFDDPIRALAFNAFGTQSEEKLAPFIKIVRQMGENDPAVPLTVTRAMFIDYMREGGAEGDALMGVPVSEFGTPGFWTKCLLARIARHVKDQPTDRVVVLDLSTVEQYKALTGVGFKPYHVACHNATRSERGAVASSVNPLAAQIEQSTTKELSQNPGGGKLWCIWNDPIRNQPSGRLMSLQEFLDAYK